jgi:branched-chain amino acid transport system substrate-binding protein
MSKLKKLVCFILTLVLAAVLFSGCGGSSDSSGKIKIGLNYELSGDNATYGQDTVDGVMMAIEEINKAGGVLGKQIDPIKMDNKSDSAEATSVATRLMTQDKVVAILGPATSGPFMAQIPVATQNKIPVMSASTTAEYVTMDEAGNVKEYAFRICFKDSFQGTLMANFALEKLNATKAVIIFDNTNDYSLGLSKSFKETFTSKGGTIVTEEAFVTKETDFNAILTKIKGLDFDVIFLPSYYQEAGPLIKQARALEINNPILGADGFDSSDLVELAGASALNDVYFSNHYSSLDKDPKVLEFIENYKKKYGKDPNAFNALGYDLGYFVADAIKRANSDNPEKIKDALAATEEFKGITGTVKIDEKHDAIKSAVIIELKNGEQVSATKFNP